MKMNKRPTRAATQKRRSATAYTRLAYKASTSRQQAEQYMRMANMLRREADRMDETAAQRRQEGR